MLRTKAFRLVGALAAGLVLLLTGPVDAQTDPPGNNGTVKVDGVDFDSHQNNEPHVGCVFQIDFYGFDQGNLFAQVTFTGVPPTGGGTLASDSVFIGGDPAGGAGDLDASRTYDLSAALASIPPHPQQGHHVHLTVFAQGAQGGGAKQKTFWVEGCGGPPPTTTTAPTTTTTAPTTTTTQATTTTAPSTTTTTKPPETTTTTEATTTTSTSTSTTEAPPTSAGPTTTHKPAGPVPGPSTTPPRPSTSPSTVRHETQTGDLARTGSDTFPIVGVGLGLLALGVVLALLARRYSA
jgi:hypothetical protein